MERHSSTHRLRVHPRKAAEDTLKAFAKKEYKAIPVKKYITLFFIGLLFLLGTLHGCTSQSHHKITSADGVTISYQVKGTGNPALVFVHGWCCDKSYWKAQMNHFSTHYKVITIDLAGHGDSGCNRTSWTIEAFGQDVAAVVEKLKLDQVILIGHSMGGPVNLEATRLLSTRIIGLVGADTYQSFERRMSKTQREQFLKQFQENFQSATGNFVRSMFTTSADPDLVKQVVDDMSSAPPEIGIAAMEALFLFDPTKTLKKIRQPIYCINSDKYPTDISGNQQYADSFKVKLMPGMGHFVMMEDAPLFNKLLTEIIGDF